MNHVLVVDDDPAVRSLCSLCLKWEGLEVLTAENGLEALESVWSEWPSVIVLDLQMPLMDGLAFFREIEGPLRPPVVVLSVFDAARTCRELGVEKFIQKPFDPTELVTAVERLRRNS